MAIAMAVGFLFGTAATSAPQVRVMEAVRVARPPRIDGRLDDEAWQQAQWQGGFVQREPEEGAPGTEPTCVAVVYDDHSLYIGVRCLDSQPDLIVAREMRRDARLDEDDNFQIVLDTYHDRRTGYYFVVNPLGARRDATLADEGSTFNAEWDGIWECKTSRDSAGWYAEISIPWKTLRFPRRPEIQMGINFQRTVRRKNEDQYWQLVPRDRGFTGFLRMSEAGILRGLRHITPSSGFELMPYSLAGLQRDQQTSFRTLRKNEIGIDAKWMPAANLALDLTWNTDFAQVEADQEIVNLTRFSLYYPEKRDFFLEGAEIFAFGESPGFRRRMFGVPLQIFYSRRIGLADGSPVPILGGARLTGKLGRYVVGALNIVTDRAELGDHDEKEIEPRTNYTAIRLRRDIFSRSTIGFMALNKQVLEGDWYNRTLGVDARFLPSQEVSLSLAAAETFSPDRVEDGEFIPGKRDNYAFYGGFRYSTDLWSVRSSYLDIARHFNPEMGFVRRKDIRRFSGSIRYQPRPRNIRAVRQFFYGVELETIHDHAGHLLDRNLEANFTTRFENSSFFRLGVTRSYEFLDDDWEVRPGILVPKGPYEGYNVSAFFRGDESKRIMPELRVRRTHYYGGVLYSGGLEGTVTAIPRVRLELDYAYNYVNLPGGHFETYTLGTRFIYYFSTNLYFKAYVQWKRDPLAEKGKREAIANLLLRYTIKDGSDLYVVYNHMVEGSNGNTAIENRVLVVKFVWFVRT